MEETQTIEKDNEALIQEMISKAQEAPEPGGLPSVIHKGDDDIPMPIVTAEMKSAGYIWMWQTKTRKPSKFNRNMVPVKLKLKFPDGTPVWTINKPSLPPKRGKELCLLHPDDPNRAHYDEIGLAVCPANGLDSRYSVIDHMQKKHPQEWKVIELERTDAEKEEQRDFQKAMLNKVTEPARVQIVERKVRKVKKTKEA